MSDEQPDRYSRLTDRELERWWRIIYRRLCKWFEGGLTYGVDWPTLRACYPHTYTVLKDLLAEAEKRGIV